MHNFPQENWNKFGLWLQFSDWYGTKLNSFIYHLYILFSHFFYYRTNWTQRNTYFSVLLLQFPLCHQTQIFKNSPIFPSIKLVLLNRTNSVRIKFGLDLILLNWIWNNILDCNYSFSIGLTPTEINFFSLYFFSIFSFYTFFSFAIATNGCIEIDF